MISKVMIRENYSLLQGHHRHSTHQPRSSSHQRSSNSSSSSASVAPRNASFEPGFYRAKNNIHSHQAKSASAVSKKKGSGPARQNQQLASKFAHQHGNVASANLRVPPPLSTKTQTTHANVNSAGIANGGGANNSTKGKITSMKPPPSHYVVVQRHTQNPPDHRHHPKQSPK